MATAGSLPPLSNNGKSFINDPKLFNTNETKASIKLKFLTPKDKEVIIIRNFRLSIKNKKYEFKSLEQILKSYDKNGQQVTVNNTCLDIDRQVPLLMHASKAILENVIFCHQEDTNWPFSEAGTLKKVFDEIFDTAKYTKALEDLKDTKKSFESKAKDLKNKIELIQKDFEQFNRINHNIEIAEKKITELSQNVEELNKIYKKTSCDLEQILGLERTLKECENGIKLARTKVAEKKEQISTITADPLFKDYTIDENTYQMYINNYTSNIEMSNNDNDNKDNTKDNSKIERYKTLMNQVKQHNEEMTKLDAIIISKQQIYENFKLNIKEMISRIIKEDALGFDETIKMDINLNSNINIDTILNHINKKEQEIKQRINELEDKKEKFISKANIKENDILVTNQLYNNKVNEISTLENKKQQLLTMISNVNENSSKLNEIEQQLSLKNNELEQLNYQSKTDDSNVKALENKTSQLKLHLNKMGIDITTIDKQNISLYNFHFTKLKTACDTYHNNETHCISIIEKINKVFKVSFSFERHLLLQTLTEITEFINQRREEVIEQKQRIREENLKLTIEIEQQVKNVSNKKEEINQLTFEKEKRVNELKQLLLKVDISFQSEDDIQNIFMIKSQIDLTINELQRNHSKTEFEQQYLETYVDTLTSSRSCSLCSTSLTEKEIKYITNEKHIQIKQLKNKSSKENEIISSKEYILKQLNYCDSEINSLKNILEQISQKTLELSELESTLNILNQKRRTFDNDSKEKSFILSQMNEIISQSSTFEDIFKLKTEREETQKQIDELSKLMNLNNINNNNNNIEQLLNEAETKAKASNEIAEIEKEINEYESQIHKLNCNINLTLQNMQKISNEIKTIEKNKSDLISMCDINEIKSQINEIENQLRIKTDEKNNLESKQQQHNELKVILLNNKKQFEILYNSKTYKYNNILSTISNFKIKYEYINADFLRSLNNLTSSMLDDNNNTPEQMFLQHLKQLQNDKCTLHNKLQLLQSEVDSLSNENKIYENEQKQKQALENIFKNNQRLHKIKSEIKELDEYITTNEGKLEAGSRLFHAKELLMKKNHDAVSNYNLNLGKLEELKSYLNRLNTEKRHDNFTNIEKRYSRLKAEYILALETARQIENYYEALDQALLKYHGKRMEEINKLIEYYWTMTYKGKDIKSIEIRSDFEKIGRSRNYNYRIVFKVNEEQELDMRGRCSAGQKILASIIIRLALAETFCNNCGILCLDEPTTNLDETHSRSLANSLREIIQNRSNDSHFQLIIITHDPVFVDLIGSEYCDSFWHVQKDDKKGAFSSVELKRINEIFNN